MFSVALVSTFSQALQVTVAFLSSSLMLDLLLIHTFWFITGMVRVLLRRLTTLSMLPGRM